MRFILLLLLSALSCFGQVSIQNANLQNAAFSVPVVAATTCNTVKDTLFTTSDNDAFTWDAFGSPVELGSDFVAASSYTACTVSFVCSNNTGSGAILTAYIYTNDAHTIGTNGTRLGSGTILISSIPNARSTNSITISSVNIISGGTYTLSINSPNVAITGFHDSNFQGAGNNQGTWKSIAGQTATQQSQFPLQIQAQASP